jgi:hypothetical protein
VTRTFAVAVGVDLRTVATCCRRPVVTGGWEPAARRNREASADEEQERIAVMRIALRGPVASDEGGAGYAGLRGPARPADMWRGRGLLHDDAGCRRSRRAAKRGSPLPLPSDPVGVDRSSPAWRTTAARDVGPRAAAGDRPRCPHVQTAPARLTRPADAHRSALDAAPPGLLPLAAGLRKVRPHPSAHPAA